MSHETSPSTHQPYGLARVTRVWQVPRSTVYAQRNRRDRPTPVAKRGPKPPQSDAELTAAIRAVIAASPVHGEGHRKIWARLRVQGLRTSKRRTLVVMRAADLLGPARLPTPVAARPHDSTIVTASPNMMWGTDATAAVTLADGHVTIFGAIDHCTAECVGLHAATYGTRFEALEPVRQGVRDHFGAMAAGVASGLTMRHDHGSQYMSDDFQAELRFLGIVSLPAFVRQPEGNGCIERFFRTLKEQPAVGAPLYGCRGRHCQVDENHVDRPPRYWALARRGPTMLGIKNSRQPQLDNTALSLVPDRTQPILAENSLLPVVAGQRPYLLDSYMFRIFRDDDPSFGDRLWRDLRGRRFPAVILERDPHTKRGSEWYRSDFFGRGFIDELERHYREVGRVGERVVYVPKQPPPFDE